MDDMLEGILETALYADDLDKAEAFYGSVLGLEKISRPANRHVFFRCGPGVLLIFNPAGDDQAAAGRRAAGSSAWHHGAGHMCFRVPKQLGAWEEKLKAAGIAIESEVSFGRRAARSFYFRDPAGNSLECAEASLWAID
jgi:catechol 2,3-dioxygenase-like lactoylglutathione lyase family enzyme